MRRLILYVMLLTIIFGVFTCISDNLSSPPTISLQELGLSRCGNDLCVGAVQPSTMSWETTRAILSADPDIIFDDYGASEKQENVDISFFPGLSEPDTNIVITTHLGLIQVHDLIDLFGEPCAITLTNYATGFDVLLEFPLIIAEINLGVWKSNESLSPDIAINSLILWSDMPQCNQRIVLPASFNVSLNWCGFASVDHYLRHCRKTY